VREDTSNPVASEPGRIPQKSHRGLSSTDARPVQAGYKAGLSGGIATYFGDRLNRIEGPLLVFERSFDMVVTDNAIAVLNIVAFEGVFRDIDAMVDRRPTWSDAAVAALPCSATRAARAVGVAAQLHGMYERGVFERVVTVPQLRTQMNEQKLDAARMIVKGKLVLDDADVAVVLKPSTRSYTPAGTATPHGTSEPGRVGRPDKS